jgi:hypothetical protein
VESPKDGTYNCISLAAGVTTIKWWPVFRLDTYWPPKIASADNLDCFIKAFGTLGYEECDDGSSVGGMEKIALYTTNGSGNSRVLHAARQIKADLWASKLGGDHDIHHTQHAVSGGAYGQIAAYMQRPKQS